MPKRCTRTAISLRSIAAGELDRQIYAQNKGKVMKATHVEENTRERERLRFLVEGLTDEQLSTPLGTDWTIAVALAHLAFWDQRSLVLTYGSWGRR